MNYYKQGDAAKAERIKAAFEAKGYDVTGFDMSNNNILFFTYRLERGGNVISTTNANLYTANIIKTHHDYQELELPKPHYDIANFHAGMPVLVRETSLNTWQYVLFSHCYIGGDGLTRFNAGLVGFTQCIPFNDDTKHLLGTTDPCGEEYINW